MFVILHVSTVSNGKKVLSTSKLDVFGKRCSQKKGQTIQDTEHLVSAAGCKYQRLD